MLRFDEWGLIVDSHAGDGGDSANRAGLLAILGWPQDLRRFECVTEINRTAKPTGLLCRHPVQTPWNHPGNFTRDQLLPFAAGAWAQGEFEMLRRLFWGHARRGFFAQNIDRDALGTRKRPWPHHFENDRGERQFSVGDFADILGPDHIWHLILCAELRPFYFFAVIGYPWLVLSILFHGVFSRSDDEGQILAQCFRAGPWFLKLYALCKRNYRDSLRRYWAEQRNMSEIAEALIRRIEHA